MGGAEGKRGYLVQTIVALADALSSDDEWVRVSLEPGGDQEHIDILWEYPDHSDGVQVRSSAPKLTVGGVKRWAEELASKDAAKPSGSRLVLILVGPCCPDIETLGSWAGVEVPPPRGLHVRRLFAEAACALHKYLRARDSFQGVTPKKCAWLADGLYAWLDRLSVGTHVLTKDALHRRIDDVLVSLRDSSRQESAEAKPEELSAEAKHHFDQGHIDWAYAAEADAIHRSLLCNVPVDEIARRCVRAIYFARRDLSGTFHTENAIKAILPNFGFVVSVGGLNEKTRVLALEGIGACLNEMGYEPKAELIFQWQDKLLKSTGFDNVYQTREDNPTRYLRQKVHNCICRNHPRLAGRFLDQSFDLSEHEQNRTAVEYYRAELLAATGASGIRKAYGTYERVFEELSDDTAFFSKSSARGVTTPTALGTAFIAAVYAFALGEDKKKHSEFLDVFRKRVKQGRLLPLPGTEAALKLAAESGHESLYDICNEYRMPVLTARLAQRLYDVAREILNSGGARKSGA